MIGRVPLKTVTSAFATPEDVTESVIVPDILPGRPVRVASDVLAVAPPVIVTTFVPKGRPGQVTTAVYVPPGSVL